MRFNRFIFTVTLLLYTSVTTATVIKVPQDQSTIQSGIDASTTGDTVLVDTGRYVENINFNRKNIVVGSLFLTTGDTSYISKTVIDGDSSGSVVTFENGEDTTVVLTGFIIINGSAFDGGGIVCGSYSSPASPSLMNLTVIANTAQYDGGGIYCRNSSPSFTNVLICWNMASWSNGGGIYCNNSSPSFVNVTVTENSATEYEIGHIRIGGSGSGIYLEESRLILVNSIVWNNSIAGHYLSDSLNAFYCDIASREGEGNIVGDPLFAGSGVGDFTLQESSPCIDAGTAFLVWEGDTIVNLLDTTYEGNAPDMGAFESPYSVGVSKEEIIPTEFSLVQNYPNPFNPSTTIDFSIPKSGLVTLTAYDILGRELETILNKNMDAGHHKVQWYASDIPSGIYFIKMQAFGFSQVRKAMVLR